MRKVLLFVGIVSGCGSGKAALPPASSVKPVPRATAERPRTKLDKSEVVAVVQQGLGRFLQKVEVEPSFVQGRFQGFRIVRLRPAEFWQGVDLKPGDVVLKVNGLPIERETQAYDAFQTLRTASELRVDYLREEQPRALVYPIIERQK
jgi:type II secretory pathway component PulC